MKYKVSKYNHWISYNNVNYVFNLLTRSMIIIPDGIDSILKDYPEKINDFPEEFTQMLLKSKIILENDIDELGIIKSRLNSKESIFLLTIAPTFDCNLACSYCFQNHQKHVMDENICDMLITAMEKRLKEDKTINELRIHWYGGEPFLAIDIMKYLSEGFIKICTKNDIKYKSNVVSNGTLIKPEHVGPIKDMKIESLQFTIDGTAKYHNVRRPYLDGKPSFDDIVASIKLLAPHVDLKIRINVDHKNLQNASQLLDYLIDQSVFSNAKNNILPYISMVGPVTEICNLEDNEIIDVNKFYDYALEFQKLVLNKLPNYKPENVFELPNVINKACGAQEYNSLCIDSYGKVFKCGLEVHDSEKGGKYFWEDYENHQSFKKWVEFDPLSIKKCKICKYLPICFGGCQKHKIEKRAFYRSDSCNHWNDYLDKILISYLQYN